jgi:hypothetical protein
LDQPQPNNPDHKNITILPWPERVQIGELRRELEGLLKDKER